MACPICQHSEWKKASLVHNEGIQSTKTVTRTAGVGASGGRIGVGTAASQSSGYQQSNLSKLAAPPVATEGPFSKTFSLLFMLFAIDMLIFYVGFKEFDFGYLLFALIFLVFIVLLGRFLWKRENIHEAKNNKIVSKWKETKMCTRCGHFY